MTMKQMSFINCVRMVKFDNSPPKIHLMVKWSFAYRQSRCGAIWQQYARDGERFRRRIQLESILEPILQDSHRKKIYEVRFKEKC